MAGNREALVLVVEDNPTNLLALRALLTYIGVRADYAQGGREAVAAVERGRYRLVLMDLMMPELDGFAAAKLIRRHEYGTGRYTPIVAVTALDPELSREQCIEAGINDFVNKPLDQYKLRAQLAHWVGRLPQADPPQGAEVEPDRRTTANAAEMRRIYGSGNAEEILESFLAVTDELLHNLSQAIDSKDLPAATYFAHEVKGSSLMVCAVEMAQLAFKLEAAIKLQNWFDVIKCYSALVAGFRRITVDLRTPVKGILRRRNGASENRPH